MALGLRGLGVLFRGSGFIGFWASEPLSPLQLDMAVQG